MKTIYTTLFVAVLFLSISCGSSKGIAKKADPFIGNWEMQITNTPQGDINNTLLITKNEDGTYKGVMASEMGTMDLNDVKIIESKLTSSFVYEGMDFELNGTFDDKNFDGEVSGMGSSFPTKGTKILE